MTTLMQSFIPFTTAPFHQMIKFPEQARSFFHQTESPAHSRTHLSLTYGHLWKPTFAEIACEWQAGKALAFTTGPGALPQLDERRMLAIRT